jgi:hypothetical protein
MMLAAVDGWSPAEVTALVAVVGLVLAALSAWLAKGASLRSSSESSDNPAKQSDLDPSTADDAAARALGRSLGSLKLSAKATAEVMAAFWAAEAPTRRALANIVAGIIEVQIIADEAKILAVVQTLPVTAPVLPERDKKGLQSN